MKHLLALLFTLLLTSNSYAINPEGKVLDFEFNQTMITQIEEVEKGTLGLEHKVQNTEVWCWAATVAMVAQYHTGQQVQDCQILSAYFNYNCCGYPMACNRPGNDQEMNILLGNLFGIQSQWSNGPFNFQALAWEIDNGFPLIAKLFGGGQIGHVIVISGYFPDGTVVINDPLSRGPARVHYNQLFNYNGMRWVGTLQARYGF